MKDLGIDFTIDDQVSSPGGPLKTVTRNLLPNGENILVDNKNRPRYISYVARHRLVTQPGLQTRAFLRGLTTIIDPSWLRMFNQNELQWLVGGESSEIDVEDLHRNTDYSGPHSIGDDGEEHPTIKLFWQVMRGLEDSQRREVLKYVTSTLPVHRCLVSASCSRSLQFISAVRIRETAQCQHMCQSAQASSVRERVNF